MIDDNVTKAIVLIAKSIGPLYGTTKMTANNDTQCAKQYGQFSSFFNQTVSILFLIGLKIYDFPTVKVIDAIAIAVKTKFI